MIIVVAAYACVLICLALLVPASGIETDCTASLVTA